MAACADASVFCAHAVRAVRVRSPCAQSVRARRRAYWLLSRNDASRLRDSTSRKFRRLEFCSPAYTVAHYPCISGAYNAVAAKNCNRPSAWCNQRRRQRTQRMHASALQIHARQSRRAGRSSCTVPSSSVRCVRPLALDHWRYSLASLLHNSSAPQTSLPKGGGVESHAHSRCLF